MFKSTKVALLVAAVSVLSFSCGNDVGEFAGTDLMSTSKAEDPKISQNPLITVTTDKTAYKNGEAVTITVRVENPYDVEINIWKGCCLFSYLIDGKEKPKGMCCMAIPSKEPLAAHGFIENKFVHTPEVFDLSLGAHTLVGKYYNGLLSSPITFTVGDIVDGPGIDDSNAIPTLFVHGHGNDVWAWKPMIDKVKGSRYVHNNGGGIYAGDAEMLAENTYPKNSIWNFGYYKEKNSDTAQYGYEGRVGGIPIDRTIFLYPIYVLPGVYTDHAGCLKLYTMGGPCDPYAPPTEVVDSTYASRISYANQLKRAVNGILKATGASHVNIVSHSMGGLVARAYIKWLGGDGVVTKLLTVGTPNHGVSDLSEHVFQFGLKLPLAEFVSGKKGQDPDPQWQKVYEDYEMYPKTTDEFHFDHAATKLPLFQGQTWLYHLNNGSTLPTTTKIATIAGNYNNFSLGTTCFIICINNYDTVDTWFKLFSGFSIKPPPDDGAVNVSEVQIDGAEFNKVIKAAHGRPEAGKELLGVNDSELLLTENSEVAKTISDWIFETSGVQANNTESEGLTSAILEDGGNLNGWANIDSDLDVFELALNNNTHSIHFGGTDKGGSWIGQLKKSVAVNNWSTAKYIQVDVRRGPTYRGGVPSLTFKIYDKNGAEIILHRDEDDYLPWYGGGWRTLITNNDLKSYAMPLRNESGFDWGNVSAIKIELRKTVSESGAWDVEPDDVHLHAIHLVMPWNDKDSDEVLDILDNCPTSHNPEQEDIDDNGIGDECDLNKPHFDILLEDAEDISDWVSYGAGLNKFALSSDMTEGSHSMVIGGIDVDKSWIGKIEKDISENNWTNSPNIKFWAKRGSDASNKGSPSVTFIAIDGGGNEVQLHNSKDTFLPWAGGGWRTIIGNSDWEEYLLAIRPANIDYSNIKKIRIELRRTIYGVEGAWPWDKEPDDVYIDNLRLDPFAVDESAVEFLDKDGDGISDNKDNCPDTFNTYQFDWNGNDVGDACEDSPPGEPMPDLVVTKVEFQGGKYLVTVANIGDAPAPANPYYYLQWGYSENRGRYAGGTVINYGQNAKLLLPGEFFEVSAKGSDFGEGFKVNATSSVKERSYLNNCASTVGALVKCPED